MPLTNQSKVIQNSAKDTERSLGSNFDLLIISEIHYSPSVNFTNVSLSVPKVTGSFAITLFFFFFFYKRPTSLLLH